MAENLGLQDDEILVLESIYSELNKIGTKEYQLEIEPRLEVEPEGRFPPLVLRFGLPEGYPSSSPPTFSLSAPWITRAHEDTIKEALLSMFMEQKGSIILFTWIEWLKENVISFVGLQKEDYMPYLKSSGQSTSDDTSEQAAQNREQLDRFGIKIIHGDPVTDRKSKFQAHLARVSSVDDVHMVIRELLYDKKIAVATHNISAYRIELPNGRIEEFRDDDGETGAGDKLLFMMARMDVRNAVVVVSRWYGGIQLGPDRFKHINNVAKELIEQVGLSRHSLQQQDDQAAVVKGKDSSKASQQKKKQPRK